MRSGWIVGFSCYSLKLALNQFDGKNIEESNHGLSAEVADWFWRIGAWKQVVGVTAFFEPSSDAPRDNFDSDQVELIVSDRTITPTCASRSIVHDSMNPLPHGRGSVA